MITNKQLADLIFPDITETIEDLEKRYPVRDLPEGAQVRFKIYSNDCSSLSGYWFNRCISD